MPNSAHARRQQLARRQETEWLLVSERNRCPVCGAAEGCHRDLEGAFVCCARRTSDWPLTSGAWLHRVTVDESSAGEPMRAEVVSFAARAEAQDRRPTMSGSTH